MKKIIFSTLLISFLVLSIGATFISQAKAASYYCSGLPLTTYTTSNCDGKCTGSSSCVSASTGGGATTAGKAMITCSIDGAQFNTVGECTSVCKSTSGLQGVCSSSIIISPAYINTMIQKYTQWFMVIVGSIAVIVIIYAGLLYITAKGDPEKGTKARKMLIYAFVGLAITLLAGGAMWTILNFVKTS